MFLCVRALRLLLLLQGADVSAWHDIPLFADAPRAMKFNFVSEVPIGATTGSMMEVAADEALNPIRQQRQLSSSDDAGMPFNYGKMPQTWSDPRAPHALTQRAGGNAPLDVIDLSEVPLAVGSVRAVRVLGALAFVNDGKTDWQLVAIDAAHPLAEDLFGEESIERHFPGKLTAVRQWLMSHNKKTASTEDGQPLANNNNNNNNSCFAFDGQLLSRPFAHALVWEAHRAWGVLCRGEVGGLGLAVPSPASSARPVAATSSLNSLKLTSADVSFVSDTDTRLRLRDFALQEVAARRTEPIYKNIRSAYLDARKNFISSLPAASTHTTEEWGEQRPTVSNPAAGGQGHEHLLRVRAPASMPPQSLEAPELHANLLERIARMYGPRAKVVMKSFFATPPLLQATHEHYSNVAMTYKAACTRSLQAADDASLTPAQRQRIEEQVTNDLGVACEALHRFGIERDPTTRLSIPHSYRSKESKEEARSKSNKQKNKANNQRPPTAKQTNSSDNSRLQADLEALRSFEQK